MSIVLRKITPHIVALLFFIIVACLATFPLVQHMNTHIITLPGDLGDEFRQNVWNVWWVHQALAVQHTNPYATHMLFYPQGTSLYLHSLDLPVGLMGLPIVPLFGIVTTYNILTIGVLVLAGYCSFLLAWSIVRNIPAALVTGTIVLCYPERLNEVRLAQLHTFTDFGVPLALLALFIALEHRTWKASLLVALTLLLSGLCSWYHLFHLSLVMTVILVWRVAQKYSRTATTWEIWQELHVWLRIALLSGLLIVPLLLPAILESVAAPYAWKSDDLVFSADLLHLVPSIGGVWQRVPPEWLSPSLFSLVPVLLALGGVSMYVRKQAPEHIAYLPPLLCLTIALVCILFSLGPRLLIGGTDTGIPMPYALFRTIPVLDTFRAPMRLNGVANLMFGLLAAYGLSRIIGRRAHTRAILSMLITILVIAEAIRLPMPFADAAVSPFYTRIGQEPGEWSVLEFPLDRFNRGVREMYTQTFHGKYILTGQVSRNVPTLPHEVAPPIAQVQRGDTRNDIVSLSPQKRHQFLQALRIRYITIRTDPNRPDMALRQVEAAHQALGPITQVYADQEMQAYRLDDVAAWLDGPGKNERVDVPLFFGLNGQWKGLEQGWFGFARWLPPEGAGFWAHTMCQRQVVLHLSLYSLPQDTRPLELWLNGRHIQTLPIPKGQQLRRYSTSPLTLSTGTNLIELHAPFGGVSPRELGIGNDNRPLSFSIHQVTMQEL